MSVIPVLIDPDARVSFALLWYQHRAVRLTDQSISGVQSSPHTLDFCAGRDDSGNLSNVNLLLRDRLLLCLALTKNGSCNETQNNREHCFPFHIPSKAAYKKDAQHILV